MIELCGNLISVGVIWILDCVDFFIVLIINVVRNFRVELVGICVGDCVLVVDNEVFDGFSDF